MWHQRIIKAEHYSKKTKLSVLVSGIILAAVLGILDFLTGYEISFSIGLMYAAKSRGKNMAVFG